jgi:hypothetical protein
MFANPRMPVNSARFTFLDPRAASFFVDWEHAADDSVAVLRGEAGRNPQDPDLSALVGELSTQSEEFRTRWARHDVRYHDTGKKRFHHPVVGDLELTFEVMTLVADPSSRCSPSPQSPTRNPKRHSTCSRAGPRRSTKPKHQISVVANGACPTPSASPGVR